MNGRIYGNICETIGRTPLISLNRLAGEGCAEILAKCESFNPGGSVKDRISLAMIEDAENRGIIKPGTTLVEPTSGNTGIGLAMVAAQKGYPLILVMPDTMTLERRRLVQAYGARVILTPGAKGMKGAIAGAKKVMAEIPDCFQPSQFDNPSNPDVHRRTTAEEIMADTGGRLDAFVAGVGTGGTITGVGRVIRKRIGKGVLIVAVEPKDSPVLSGGQPGKHGIQGIGAGFIPENYDGSLVDRIVQVTYEDSVETARRLGKEEAILAGISTGAILHTAMNVARELGPGKRVVAVVCDTGERYLSTPLFPYEEPETLALE